MSETTNAKKYSIRSNLHQLTVQYQNKVALNPFDDKRMYLNRIQSLPWDKHTQKGDCLFILCIKFIGLYYKELFEASEAVTENKTDTKPLRDEEIYLNIWYWKEKLTHQELLKRISDRAHLLLYILSLTSLKLNSNLIG